MTESNRVLPKEIAEKLKALGVEIPENEIVGWHNVKDGGYIAGKMCPVRPKDNRGRYVPTTDFLGAWKMLKKFIKMPNGYYYLRYLGDTNVFYYEHPSTKNILFNTEWDATNITECFGKMLVKLKEEGV
jgi:hypothetical protein